MSCNPVIYTSLCELFLKHFWCFRYTIQWLKIHIRYYHTASLRYFVYFLSYYLRVFLFYTNIKWNILKDIKREKGENIHMMTKYYRIQEALNSNVKKKAPYLIGTAVDCKCLLVWSLLLQNKAWHWENGCISTIILSYTKPWTNYLLFIEVVFYVCQHTSPRSIQVWLRGELFSSLIQWEKWRRRPEGCWETRECDYNGLSTDCKGVDNMTPSRGSSS